jgi:hypothetical protein
MNAYVNVLRHSGATIVDMVALAVNAGHIWQ